MFNFLNRVDQKYGEAVAVFAAALLLVCSVILAVLSLALFKFFPLIMLPTPFVLLGILWYLTREET